MKIKRLFANLFVLVIFGGVVFFIGWITFLVKPGFCAVMTSKTSGIYEKPILPDSFVWKWERLLPTNVALETFDLAPFKSTQVVSGQLPSARLYSEFAAKNVDFSYNIKLNLTFSLSADSILELYKNNVLRTNDDLQEYYENRAKLAASFISQSLLKSKGHVIRTSVFSEDEILKILMANKNEFNGIAFSSVEISDCSLPDIELYEKAKESYNKFLETLDKTVEEEASRHAKTYLEQKRFIDQLERLGETLKKYPDLQDMFKTADAASIMNLLNSVK